jgi:hypothetical protein
MSSLSEIEFLRTEMAKLYKRTLELEFDNKRLVRELADSRVFAYTQQKDVVDEPCSVSSASSASATEPSAALKGVVAAAAAVSDAEQHRVAKERKRLQGLWVEHKVGTGRPMPKLLATLRKGLKESNIPF